MKEFFKMFLASLTAIVVSGFILSVLFIIAIVSFSVSAMSEPAVKVESKSILMISLNEIGGDYINGSPFEYLDFATMEVNMPVSTSAAIASIQAAASDENIKAIALVNESERYMGMAQMQEVRDALVDFKKSGKKVYSYGKSYSNADYYFATVADEVILCPEGVFIWNGLSTQIAFFKNMLDKVGVEVTAIKHGKYKSAIEPFTLSGMSEASREQNSVLLNSVWGELTNGISISRGITPEILNEYANNLTIDSDSMAYKLNMVDTLMYSDQFDAMLKRSYGKDYKTIALRKYATTVGYKSASKSNGTVAVIYAEGNIVDGKSAEGNVGDKSLRELLIKARENKDIKAVVLRINSPGGSALAAELICREVELLQKEKPVIASFGNVAASGGYYIAAPADMIVASPATVTGSIGVFGLMANVQKGLKDKLGVDIDIVQTNTHGAFGTPFRPLDKAEEAFMQKSVDKVYTTFVKRVAKGRNLTFAQVDSIAGGRVWSGVDAMKVGLVDGMGGLDKAIALAADRAGLDGNFDLTTLSDKKSLFYEFFGTANAGYAWLVNKDITKTFGNSMLTQFNHMTKVVGNNAPQAMMPYLITIE